MIKISLPAVAIRLRDEVSASSLIRYSNVAEVRDNIIVSESDQMAAVASIHKYY